MSSGRQRVSECLCRNPPQFTLIEVASKLLGGNLRSAARLTSTFQGGTRSDGTALIWTILTAMLLHLRVDSIAVPRVEPDEDAKGKAA